LGEYDKAIEDYDWGIQQDPNYASAYNNRGFAYAELGQYQLAIQDFDKAIQLDPKNGYVYYSRGVA
jgi:tetratricopeptide (TPR) repeat protein